MTVQVLLVEDHLLLRQAYRRLIDKEEDMEVVGEAGDGPEAIELSHHLEPDVVLMDISMPILNGIEATLQIRQNQSMVKVLGVSIHRELQYIHRMLEAGASGYVIKDEVVAELIPAIRTVMSNESYLSSSVGEILCKNAKKPVLDR